MKKVKTLSILLLLLVVLSSAVKSVIYYPKASSLEIKGYVFEEDKKVDGAMVKLYQNNKIVQITKTKKSKFQFILFAGKQYMVEVDKPGSVSERIQISTKEPTEFGGKYTYEFRVDLIDATKFEGVDISNLDFPTAIIKYDLEEGEYMHDANYSKQVKADLKKIKMEAKTKK